MDQRKVGNGKNPTHCERHSRDASAWREGYAAEQFSPENVHYLTAGRHEYSFPKLRFSANYLDPSCRQEPAHASESLRELVPEPRSWS
jgi:hypothetical protein